MSNVNDVRHEGTSVSETMEPRVVIEWSCSVNGCDQRISITSKIVNGQIDENDVYPPKAMSWCRDDDGEHILCEKHLSEWLKKAEQENPGEVWTA